MSVDIRLVSLRDFIRTDVAGTFDLEGSKAVLTEIVKSSDECGVPNVLIDVRMIRPEKVEPADIYTLVMHLLSLGIDPGHRFAILNDPQLELDGGKLFEQCARERGIDAAAFRDYEATLAWLCRVPS